MTIAAAVRRSSILLLGTTLLAAVVARLPGVFVRSIWYDEVITLIETSDGPTAWPEAPMPAGEMRRAFDGTPSFREVTERLRDTDVHPPVYYWILNAWRGIFGRSIETARLLSLLASVAAVAAFWGLLRRVRVEDPVVPSAAYALSLYAVHYGHEARGYALASLLVLSGFGAAIAAVQVADGASRRAFRFSALAAALLSTAFLTGYVTAFVSATFLAWLVAAAGRRGRAPALLAAIATPALAAVGLFLLRFQHQFGARPEQDVGFRGFLTEALHIAKNLGEVLCATPRPIPWGLVSLLLLVMAGATLWHGRPGGPAAEWERRFTVLAAALVVVPAAGFYVLDLAADRHLASARYLMFSGPALAFLAARGVTRIRGRLRAPALGLLGVLFVLLIAGADGNREDCRTGRSFAPYRALVRQFQAEAGPSVLAVVGSGHGRGDLWSWVYELPAEVPVLIVGTEEDGAHALRHAERFSEIWLLGATDLATRDAEEAFRDSLVAAGWRATPAAAWKGAFRVVR